MDKKTKRLLKELPKIDELLLLLEKQDVYALAPRALVKEICRKTVQALREKITGGRKDARDAIVLEAKDVAGKIYQNIKNLHTYNLRRVVNATGVILHTNLGRAPLCPEALQRINEVGRGYSNLEFDLTRGERGQRYDHASRLLCALTGAEDALIVNNNAAAVLLVINTLAEGKEAIVSRGELIEIGGEFRIPEVMSKSATRLREVGTTNRTRLKDYEKAINKETGLIMKVHTSNYRIIGFTEEAEIEELVTLGKKKRIPVMNDLGSGCLINLENYGLEHEPTVREVLKAGVDVVTFSGDKLLGGPQAGIIVGGKKILAKIKKNPLNRALRIDKFTLAALEATLMHYLDAAQAVKKLRPLKALTEPVADVKIRARKLFNKLQKENYAGLELSLRDGFSTAGGGSLPTQKIPTVLIGIKSKKMSAGRIEEKLRALEMPVIVRVDKDEVLLDPRTVSEDEFVFIAEGLKNIVSG
ncbi:MAG TPA: L-seryl-tRNA(Sec) selenium transferase [Smithellaceae bacterium]|nr:L-seryl-tRNA(Sec) selenium transferase [Smithellaceae bacterium]HRS90006.1 L-seryl-tRNA(Sec) selenium transferase [Smithellaceae bacterium]HRV26033.1 L-seryl-tRNA(Sec) selenium transferase [Smithellaceae bacterium]